MHGDLANPDVTVVCDGHLGTVQLPFWGDSNLYDPSGLFKDDGTIDNTFSPGGMVSWHWQLTPLSDP